MSTCHDFSSCTCFVVDFLEHIHGSVQFSFTHFDQSVAKESCISQGYQLFNILVRSSILSLAHLLGLMFVCASWHGRAYTNADFRAFY